MSLGGGEFRRLYPPKESVTFDGGLDDKFPPALIPDNESPDCANVVFYNGGVETREGIVKLNTTPVASAVFDGFYTRRANDLSETMIAFTNGTMWTLNTTTFITVGSAQSVFTAGANVVTDFAENYMFMGNGGVIPYKWDGTDFTRHGVYPPTQAVTVSTAGTAGLISATVQIRYGYTFVNSAAVEGDLSPLTATFTVGASSAVITLGSVQTMAASYGVAKRKIYRTLDAGSTFFLVGTIADNATTSFVDNVAAGSLGVHAPTDNGVPPKYNAILYHRNICFVNDPANPNYVWYSNPGEPYTFPSSNFFKVGDRTSDLVKGFGIYDNHLVVFCENSIWINYMQDPSDDSTWSQVPTNSPYGSKSPLCLLDYQNGSQNEILFPAVQNQKFVGFGSLAGMSLDPTNTLMTVTNAGSLLQSQRVEPDMFQVQESFLKNISGIVFKNKSYITLTYASGNTTNNRVYVFDFSISNLGKQQKNSWVPFTGWSAKQFAIYAGSLYYASSDTSGLIYKCTDTSVYSDNGSAINSYFWTKEFPGYEQEVNYSKDFRYVNLLIDNAGAYFMNLSYRVDSDKGSGQSVQIDLNPGSSLWGSMIWGVSNWGGGTNQSERRVYVGPSRGKRLQLKFSNQNVAGQRFKVHRMNFAYNLRGYR